VLKPHYRSLNSKAWLFIAGGTALGFKQCDEEGCDKSAPLYRQCPYDKCKQDIGYCKAHGGDDRALQAMANHFEVKHK
jgi:hypothetical protein